MTYLSNRSFIFEVARGSISGYSYVRKIGLNADVDSGAEEDLWAPGGDFPWQSSAQSLEIVSSSTNDVNTTGSGAQTVLVTSLDSSGNVQTETVGLNGTTAVSLSNTATFVDAEVVAVGAGGVNDGDVDVQIASGGAVLSRIPTGYGRSMQSAYQVPTGTTAYLVGWSSSLYNATSGTMQVRLMVAEPSKSWRVLDVHALSAGGTGQARRAESDLVLTLPAGSRVRVRAAASADNMAASATLVILLT